MPVTEPHDVPTAAELVEAVQEFLREDVMAATEGRVRFHARVAANVLGIVGRELRLGPEQAARHRADLAALGYDDEVSLARAIRDGEVDHTDEDLIESIRRSVASKLEVADPRYLGHT